MIRWGYRLNLLQIAIAELKSDRSVTVYSYKNAVDVLFGAFPNAQKAAGAGDKPADKTIRDKAAFKSNRQNGSGLASYHMDFKTDPTSGILYGHDSLPDGHPHKTIPHINIVTPNGNKVDIFVARNFKCCSAKKGKNMITMKDIAHLEQKINDKKCIWINSEHLKNGALEKIEFFLRKTNNGYKVGFDYYLDKYEDATDLYFSHIRKDFIDLISAVEFSVKNLHIDRAKLLNT